MADRNMSSGFSLDDILSETEKDTEKVPGKLWSLAEIDALLADEGLSESEKVQTEKAHEPKEQTEHAEKKYESAEEKNGKTPVLHTPKKEPDKKSDDSFSIDPAIFDEILSGGSRREKTESRKINAAKIEEDKKAFGKDDDSKNASGVNNASSEILPETPLFGGTTPSLTSDNENSPVQSENESVPGQISLEKTRVFNEVDARAIRSDKIEHHIGKKITRTTSSEFTDKKTAVKKGMETDKYRERFLNKPKLDMEKTTRARKAYVVAPAQNHRKVRGYSKKARRRKDERGGLDARSHNNLGRG